MVSDNKNILTDPYVSRKGVPPFFHQFCPFFWENSQLEFGKDWEKLENAGTERFHKKRRPPNARRKEIPVKKQKAPGEFKLLTRIFLLIHQRGNSDAFLQPLGNGKRARFENFGVPLILHSLHDTLSVGGQPFLCRDNANIFRHIFESVTVKMNDTV